MKTYLAYYSPSAARDFAVYLWEGVDGSTVRATAVYDTEEEAKEDYFAWSDARLAGPVLRFIALEKPDRYPQPTVLVFDDTGHAIRVPQRCSCDCG